MILTEEMIKKLPVLTEEQEKTEFWDEDEFINEGLKEYDNTMKEIMERYGN